MDFEYDYVRQAARAIAVACIVTGLLDIVFIGEAAMEAQALIGGGIVLLLIFGFKPRGKR